MIQLATDPNAQRMHLHPAANDGKAQEGAARRGRPGHAWPFLSRQAHHPAPQGAPKSSGDSGS